MRQPHTLAVAEAVVESSLDSGVVACGGTLLEADRGEPLVQSLPRPRALCRLRRLVVRAGEPVVGHGFAVTPA